MQQHKLEITKNIKQRDIAPRELKDSSSLYNILLHFLDYIAVLRPLLLIPGWTILFLGYYKGINYRSISSTSSFLPWNSPIILRPHTEILITFFLYSLLMGAIYALNQIIDKPTDEANGKLYLVARGYIKDRSLKIHIGILLFVSIAIAFIKFPSTYLYFILSSIVLGIFYSVPPIRLKGKPFLDLISNSVGFGFLAFAVGWTCVTELSLNLIYHCIPYAICVSAAFINTTIPDMKGDIQNGDKTTGVFLGIRKSCIASTILVALVPFISWYLKDYISFLASALSLPFYIYMTISNWNEELPKINTITLATKISLLVLSILIAFLIPVYFAFLIPTIILIRLYNQARFGIKYP